MLREHIKPASACCAHFHLNQGSQPIIQRTVMASHQVGGGAAEEVSAGGGRGVCYKSAHKELGGLATISKAWP